MQKNEYTTVILDGVPLRYATFDGIPHFHYRDVCRLLGSQTSMTRHIQNLKLDENEGYRLVPECPKSDRVAYFVSVPVLFKIINSLTVCIDTRKLILKDFCEKTFGIECEVKETETKHCKVCGKKIPDGTWGKRRRVLYCSEKCQKLFHKQQQHDLWFAKKAERNMTAVCPNCGRTFEKRTPQQIYCCKMCGNLGRAAQKKELKDRPKSAFYNPREVYPDVKEPVWSSAFNW